MSEAQATELLEQLIRLNLLLTQLVHLERAKVSGGGLIPVTCL